MGQTPKYYMSICYIICIMFYIYVESEYYIFYVYPMEIIPPNTS